MLGEGEFQTARDDHQDQHEEGAGEEEVAS
jgi:hypothetical protein